LKNLQVLSQKLILKNREMFSYQFLGESLTALVFCLQENSFIFLYIKQHAIGSTQQNTCQKNRGENERKIRVVGINEVLEAFILSLLAHRSHHLSWKKQTNKKKQFFLAHFIVGTGRQRERIFKPETTAPLTEIFTVATHPN
jgi:hypothetical protein